eukprot:scaffold32543_cov314-Skeletonema_menzelii.AAC.1
MLPFPLNAAAAAAAVVNATTNATTSNANGDPITAALADDESSDEDSLSSTALLQTLQGDPDDDTPGEVQMLLNDASKTDPDEKLKMELFFAKSIGEDPESDLADIVDKPGRKQLFK